MVSIPFSFLTSKTTVPKDSTFVTDITTDPQWQECKDIALKNGLEACWQTPLTDHQNTVVGILVIFNKKQDPPQEIDFHIIEKATYLISLVIQHYRAEEQVNYLAFHDALTELPNRRLFNKRLFNKRENTAINHIKYMDNRMLGI
jgi:GAF domain-containing protein